MNRKVVVSAVTVLMMVSGQFAYAQRDGNDRRGNEARRPHDNRGFGRAHDDERRRGRGVGPNSEYYRGDRLPAEYRHRNYVVNDWRSHNLSAPPRGHQWVQSGGDYALVAIATGIIAQVLLDHR